jgi:hypothetical protein
VSGAKLSERMRDAFQANRPNPMSSRNLDAMEGLGNWAWQNWSAILAAVERGEGAERELAEQTIGPATTHVDLASLGAGRRRVPQNGRASTRRGMRRSTPRQDMAAGRTRRVRSSQRPPRGTGRTRGTPAQLDSPPNSAASKARARTEGKVEGLRYVAGNCNVSDAVAGYLLKAADRLARELAAEREGK